MSLLDERTTSRHRLQCLNCMSIIESLYNHQFVTCKCGDCSVDGGPDFWGGRIVYKDRTKIFLMPSEDLKFNTQFTEKFMGGVSTLRDK